MANSFRGLSKEQVEALYDESALTNVSPKQETAIVGYIVGQSFADMAEEENVSSSAMKDRLRRGIVMMRHGGKL